MVNITISLCEAVWVSSDTGNAPVTSVSLVISRKSQESYKTYMYHCDNKFTVFSIENFIFMNCNDYEKITIDVFIGANICGKGIITINPDNLKSAFYNNEDTLAYIDNVGVNNVNTSSLISWGTPTPVTSFKVLIQQQALNNNSNIIDSKHVERNLRRKVVYTTFGYWLAAFYMVFLWFLVFDTIGILPVYIPFSSKATSNGTTIGKLDFRVGMELRAGHSVSVCHGTNKRYCDPVRLHLMDNGSLLLYGKDNHILWESSKFKSQPNLIDNNFAGDFRTSVDSNGYINIVKGKKVYWSDSIQQNEVLAKYITYS